MNIQKRYIVLLVIIVLSIILLWRINSSYADVDIGYSGNNIISGDKWGINITEITNVNTLGNALLVGDVATIGTTMNFNVLLHNPGDKVSFDVVVENTSVLNGELYTIALSGLSSVDSENITFTVNPIDSSILHTKEQDGSIIKSQDKQMFNVVVSYDDNISIHSDKEFQLNLGTTIIYKQK